MMTKVPEKKGEGEKALNSVMGRPVPAGEDDAATQQVTIRVSAEALRAFTAFAEEHGVKRNRLFDEAIQCYAAVLAAGMRIR